MVGVGMFQYQPKTIDVSSVPDSFKKQQRAILMDEVERFKSRIYKGKH